MGIKGKNKIIVILGPTSSGKTGLAVKLAYKFNGEIISADSRQVYKGMDIGTGKDLGEYELTQKHKNTKTQKTFRIPYHLIDVVSPNTEFSLAKYQKLAYKAIDDVLRRGKLPIIAGGSGLYLQAVVDNYNLSKTKPNKDLRKKMEKLSADELFKKLQKLNKKFAGRLNESERKNKQRLMRYMEIVQIPHPSPLLRKERGHYEFLLIGLIWPRKVLLERIYSRLIDRIEKEDMVGEVKRLHKEGVSPAPLGQKHKKAKMLKKQKNTKLPQRCGVSWKRLEGFGLEYKYVSLYLQKKLNYEDMVEKLNIAIRQFAKKQMSWFGRWERQGARIHWVESRGEADKLVKKFLK
ncbi:tRNA (adenosine(37)-N6)-dimethylallyltransferase MiaA [Patescibacteria group bacterium]|nr:tRNA (adenosine(37)-N6)-dimethylallyltransferase MiaA [Patescibacteria group bacterium]MCG2698290.1 tRNA (adenosine(37)-N6)-dimethylallyltransferase MiaA [Candidatus Parcubacteria bacterium]MBU4015498.1 tRNA (adenosine(37)-N6)-dimethylallyltransferase MiaA [Patescibacteria group bacterium]MBU4026405.1 tRNA (adenosine(37)-N6)-dimethylallyltransferase MiaA [Patescibacteria group bacterium]MBU4073745.1 tRNA (adenosine(37)-N6)-dimethylallyltransferase MiaA [Patescibacteria group bacterium]